MLLTQVFIVIVDISGYTKFLRSQSLSLLHAEHVIVSLLEHVMSSAQYPLIPYELHGDAITFYAISEGTSSMALEICQQVERFFQAFHEKQKELTEVFGEVAGSGIKKLKLKAVLHHGEVVITRVGKFKKIAGEDMILVHRLLKNSVVADEYVLLTENFHQLAAYNVSQTPKNIHERYPDLDEVKAWIYHPDTDPAYPDSTFSNKHPSYPDKKQHATIPSLACA